MRVTTRKGNRDVEIPKDSYPQLLSLAVHEFRTPASVVGGYLRMLQRDTESTLSDRQRKMIDEAEKSCARLVAIVAELSDVGEARRRPRQARAARRPTHSLLSLRWPGLCMRQRIATSTSRSAGGRTGPRCRATRPGSGAPSTRFFGRFCEKSRDSASSSPSGGSRKSTGGAVSHRDRRRRIERTSGIRPGTWTVRRKARRHGTGAAARAARDRRPRRPHLGAGGDRGTRAPEAPERRPAGEGSAVISLPITEFSPLKKPYVAIVDDDSGFANYLRTFLSLRGYETRSYSRGDEMLAAVKQGDPPDIVLLDVMMPGMDGLETLRALKAAKPDLQVDHAVGPRAGVDHRRSGAPRRRRLRRQAGRSRGPRRDRARRGDQEAIEKTPAGLRDHRAAPAAERRPGPRRSSFWGDSPDMQTHRARSSSRSPTATSRC